MGERARWDRYTVKRWVSRPLTAVRRRRAGDLNRVTRSMYEAHDYRPAIRRFVEASRREPDLLVDVALPPGAVVLDVGAFVGEWAERIVQRADMAPPGDLQLHAFEPEPNACRKLAAGVGRDHRVHLHPFGLAGRDRGEQLAVGGPGSSIFLPADTPGFTGQVAVELRDAGAVLPSLGVDRIALAKINIEGGEFELLDRLHETGWLPRIDVLLIQFHEFAPGAHRGRRRNRRQLAETHREVWSYPWVYERWDLR